MTRQVWTAEEIGKLYTYAVTVSQQEAGKRLGRSWQAVAAKSRLLGIRWRQGYKNYSHIAREVGCSPSTVQRLVAILYPDGFPSYPTKCGSLPLLTYEDAERVKRVLIGNLKHRKTAIKAGKISQAKRKQKGTRHDTRGSDRSGR